MEEPWHSGSGVTAGAMETLTGALGITVRVTVLEVAGFPTTQNWFDVTSHVTWSPSAGK